MSKYRIRSQYDDTVIIDWFNPAIQEWRPWERAETFEKAQEFVLIQLKKDNFIPVVLKEYE